MNGDSDDAALACVKLAEPMTFSQLFPYINEFVRYLDIADHAKQVGFYSGLLVRAVSCLLAFCVTQIRK